MCITTLSEYGSAGLGTELLAKLFHRIVNRLVFHAIHNWNHIFLDIKSLTSYHSTLTSSSKFVFLFYSNFFGTEGQRANAKMPLKIDSAVTKAAAPTYKFTSPI